MRLSKIKLAGFKSFVEPTTINLPSSLVGIVGPNGCGKSNVIDAIRWVMGESSAKHLRGDSMTDVIFNGSASRKPVGTATIELFFDNSDGSIGGQYASYAEIGIKRTVSRDGQSQYYLNNTRCRRKDITGLFLGTGLGSRSYAIIEQGMVSRLIDAKPDDLRVYIEEAAGISKYKERRRETETRIRHTRDNLDRLNDLRDEVEKQLKHLDRQAKQAERYKALKQDQRRLEAELLLLRLNDMNGLLDGHRQRLSQGTTRLESAIADQRGIEANIERSREGHVEASESFNAAQGRYYGVQGEISRLEQSIAHARERRERQTEELGRARRQLQEIQDDISKDQAQLQELDQRLGQLAPDLDEAAEIESASAGKLALVEQALSTWQETWHEFNLELKEYQQTCHVERTRIEHLDERLAELRSRSSGLEQEQSGISLDSLENAVTEQARVEERAATDVEARRKQLAETDARIAALRSQERESSTELESIRGKLDSGRGRAETLEALQQAALGEDQEDVTRWIARHGLQDQPRLAQQLVVEKDWEAAVETVLGDFLQALCVPRFDEHLKQVPKGELALIESHADSRADAAGSLLGKVTRPGSAAAMLARVRVADSLDAALAMRERLADGESVITADGIWLGQGWVRISRGQREAGGVITREQDIRQLRADIRDYEQQVARLEQNRAKVRDELQSLEGGRAQLQEDAVAANSRFAEAAAVLGGLRQDFERIHGRLRTLTEDSQQVRDEIEASEEAIREARTRLSHADEASRRLEERRPSLQRQQETLGEEYDAARASAEKDRADAARIRIELESRRASRDSARTSLERIQAQQTQLEAHVATLTSQIGEGEQPLEQLQADLQSHLQKQIDVEAELAEQTRKLEAAEAALREEETRRTTAERAVAEVRESVDELRMQVRETEVRHESLLEQFNQTGQTLEGVRESLDEAANADEWNERLAKVMRSIERLGAINLAAIEEFSEQSERKKYLDTQLEDLTAALETLEGAIRKIDRETRTRFQETFDNVNGGLKRIFPRLFGGGHAYLSLEGEDLLSAGVTIMARPPGKRNSHIHLLSGGEKALTAVALIFSIFELNPAPFCLLDEVDAPLDDANVGRFCEIVKEMSQNVQFVVITHNKATMEMARQLTGVTMNEPGVSRLVSVDIDEAVQLVAS